MKLRNPLGFSSIKNMLKDRLFKRSRLKFDNWLFRLEKFSELSGNKPQAPGMDFANLWINHSLADKFCQTLLRYPMDSAIDPSRDFPPFSGLSSLFVNFEKHWSTRGPLLESPETFWAHFRWHSFLVSSKRRRLNAQNFAIILIFLPLTTYENTSFIG